MEVIKLSEPEFVEINWKERIDKLRKDAFSKVRLFNKADSLNAEKSILNSIVTFGYVHISVLLANGTSCSHKKNIDIHLANVTLENAGMLWPYKGYPDLDLFSIARGNYSDFKQEVINQYLNNGYKAPQNEISKYLLFDNRVLIMNKSK